MFQRKHIYIYVMIENQMEVYMVKLMQRDRGEEGGF